MKKWKIIRDTLGYFGISKEEARENEVKAVSMDDDITVHYTTKDGTEFSGNIISGEHGVTDDVLVPGVPGEIFISGDSPLYINSGDTSTLIITDEEGNTIALGDLETQISNSHVTLTGLVLNAVNEGSSTVTFKLATDNSVFVKLKVFVQ